MIQPEPEESTQGYPLDSVEVLSTTKKLTEPLDEPEREFRGLKRAAWRQQQNESLAIAGRNLFDDEASSSNNTSFSLTEEEGWNRIEECVQYQDDLWDDPSPPMNISSISGVIQPTFKGRLKRACMKISQLEEPHHEIGLRNAYLICGFWRRSP
nr:hypothetical protein [Tanacetum cinerariifolium]